MTVDVDELEQRNMRARGPEAEFAIARILGGIPLDAAVELTRGLGKRLERKGFEAYFKEEAGFAVVWVRRRRPKGDDS